VNPALDKDQAKLGILILPVSLQMLPDCHRLLDEVVQVFRNFRGKTMSLKNTQDLASSNTPDLGYPVRVSENNTNLRRGQALLGELANVLLNILG